MEEIRIIEKPDTISWEEVKNCIYLAQQTNIKHGVDMNFGHYSADQLKKAVNNGYCFVALDQNDSVVGTVSLVVTKTNFWWHKGIAGLQGYEGIIPEYRGSDVFFGLHNAIEIKQKALGIKVLWATTAEKNRVVIKTLKLLGWKLMQFSPGKGSNYYSCVFAKWLDDCPYSDKRISFMYKLSKIVVKLIYKPGKVNRLAFWK